MRTAISVLVFLGLLFTSYGVFAKGFSGAILLKNGNEIEFRYLGFLNKSIPYSFAGDIDGQNVEYEIGEFQEITFGPDGNYNGDSGDQVFLLTRDGRQITLEKAKLSRLDANSRFTVLNYVYEDQITGKTSQQNINTRDVAAIRIGGGTGSIKYNPRTEQYFPWSFVYDPYTGEQLIWADQ